MTSVDEYLSAVDDDRAPKKAAVIVMDRLAERLKPIDSGLDTLEEQDAAAETIAELAGEADEPLKVVEAAKNEAGRVAQQARTPKDGIIDKLNEKTEEIRQTATETGISLDTGYALDQYLENDLERVVRMRSTDHHDETIFSWEFSDGAVVELNEATHVHSYQFYTKLVGATHKQLLSEMASEQLGDPEEDEDAYARLSLGPEDRPWHPNNWEKCIQSLLAERSETITVTGPRTEVWETISNEIARSRAVRDTDSAVENQMMTVLESDDELVEVWVPSPTIMRKTEDYAVTPKGLQKELAARGVDSPELNGERISELVEGPDTVMRFWRLDATHDEVPSPSEIVDEVEVTADSLEGVEWGDDDE